MKKIEFHFSVTFKRGIWVKISGKVPRIKCTPQFEVGGKKWTYLKNIYPCQDTYIVVWFLDIRYMLARFLYLQNIDGTG